MQGIQFKQRFTGSTRLATDINLVDDIKAQSPTNSRGWFTPDERGVSLLRRKFITLFADRNERNGGSDTLALRSGKTGAELVTDADIAFSCAQFSNAAYDHSQSVNYQAFSFGAVFKVGETGNNQIIFNGGAVSLYKAASASNLIYNYDGTTMTIPIALDEWQFVWITHTGSNMRAWINGVMQTDVAKASVSGSAAATLGSSSGGSSPYQGKMAEAWIYNVNIHASMGNAGLEQWGSYVRTYYGVDVAVLS